MPYWNGYSIGRWDGDTLVVESNNFHGVDPNNVRAAGLPDAFLGAGWLDHRGSPYTEAMKLTERFRRPRAVARSRNGASWTAGFWSCARRSP